MNKRFLKGLIILIGSIVGFILIGMLFYSMPLIELSFSEIKRTTSPDGKVDAVWMLADAGATGGSYNLYIVPAKTEITKEDIEKRVYASVFAARYPKQFEAVWLQNNLLEIQHSPVDIHHFKSYTYPFIKDKLDDRIEIKLKLLAE